MKDEPNTIILDVRTPEEFSKGHVAEAIHINFHDTINFKSNLKKLDTDNTYLIYCRTDRRSGKTFELMKQMNFKNIHVLKGGILAIEESAKLFNSDSNK